MRIAPHDQEIIVALLNMHLQCRVFFLRPNPDNVRSEFDSMMGQVRRQHLCAVIAFGRRRWNYRHDFHRLRQGEQREGIMHGPDGLAAAIPCNRDSRERNWSNGCGHHKYRATTTQDDRVSDRQRVGYLWALPFVLAQDDQVGIASAIADTMDNITNRLE